MDVFTAVTLNCRKFGCVNQINGRGQETTTNFWAGLFCEFRDHSGMLFCFSFVLPDFVWAEQNGPSQVWARVLLPVRLPNFVCKAACTKPFLGGTRNCSSGLEPLSLASGVLALNHWANGPLTMKCRNSISIDLTNDVRPRIYRKFCFWPDVYGSDLVKRTAKN